MFFFITLSKVQMLKEKQEKARLEAVVDSEQAIAELNHRNEREKQILREDNDKLAANVEFVSSASRVNSQLTK